MGESIFWKHKHAGILGISNAEMTIIYFQSAIDSLCFVIENCRGNEGRNFIEIYGKSELLSSEISVSDSDVFKGYLPAIAELWAIKTNWSTQDNHY